MTDWIVIIVGELAAGTLGVLVGHWQASRKGRHSLPVHLGQSLRRKAE